MISLPKEVWILVLCQVLFTAGISVDLTITSLAGQSLTSHPDLATVPFALLTVGGAIFMPILGWHIRNYGRRYALISGCIIGTCGAFISAASVWDHNFWGLCLGCLLVGSYQASAQFYRLAAGDLVPTDVKQYAVSLVLAGGVIAAFFGPMLAIWGANLWPSSLYVGSYLIVGILTFLCIALLTIGYSVDARPTYVERTTISIRCSIKALKQPIFLVGTFNGVLATTVMMLLMSAAPLAIVESGWTTSDSAGVMQWHLVGMFAPSLIAGFTFRKLGVITSLSMGILLMLLASILGLSGIYNLSGYYWALALLGIGWNISFVTSSILLSQGEDINMKRSAQTASETLRYFFSSIASLVAATALTNLGWFRLNMLMIPFLLVGIGFNAWWFFAIKRAN